MDFVFVFNTTKLQNPPLCLFVAIMHLRTLPPFYTGKTHKIFINMKPSV